VVGVALWILINYIPILFACGLCFIAWNYSWVWALGVLYFLPPILCRVVTAIFGQPRRSQTVPSKSSYGWWITTQLQVPFMRFPFLEEVLRMIPGFYSVWLRLWGAKVGKFIFWSPQVLIADRPFVEIGDRVIFGYGAKVTSHFLKKSTLGTYLVFGVPRIGSSTLVGAMAVIAPGASLAEGSTLEGGSGLHPFSSQKISALNNVQSQFDKTHIEEV
jgi:hypothetical protein